MINLIESRPGLRHALFAVYALAVAAIFAPVLRSLYVLASDEETASHILVIPVVALFLLVQRWRELARPVPPWWIGTAILFAAGAVCAVAGLVATPVGSTARLSVLVAAIVLLWNAGFAGLYGREGFRVARFPMVFLFLMIPVPAVMLDAAVQYLKVWSTELVAVLFNLTGTRFHRDGFVFSLPHFVIEVADECSGIRSSMALLLAALIASDRLLRTPWKRIVLVLTIIPLSVLKNGIRIVTLTLLAMYVDPGFLTGRLHHDGGIVFFLIALVLLAPLFNLLVRSERREARRTGPALAGSLQK